MAPVEDGSLVLFDLAASDRLADGESLLIQPDYSLSTNDDLPDADHIARLASIAIVFPVFSDGRGFTHARRLRTIFGFTGQLIADGHIIPDQADYLFRCGFTHVVVTPDRLGDWQQARRFIRIHFQSMPNSRHSRLDSLSDASSF